MTTVAATPLQIKGGAFLIEDRSPNEIFTAEDLNEEHLAIARTVDQFWTNEVEPHLEAIRQQTPGVAQLSSSRWVRYCDHSVTSADVRLSVGVQNI